MAGIDVRHAYEDEQIRARFTSTSACGLTPRGVVRLERTYSARRAIERAPRSRAAASVPPGR
jgi:hypothetical protein